MVTRSSVAFKAFETPFLLVSEITQLITHFPITICLQVWPGTCVFADFTNVKTQNWWVENMKAFHSEHLPFDGFWLVSNTTYCTFICFWTYSYRSEYSTVVYKHRNCIRYAVFPSDYMQLQSSSNACFYVTGHERTNHICLRFLQRMQK